jgi:tRNA A37 threonylcarbamoyladenosine biosynthesis protein TsaE
MEWPELIEEFLPPETVRIRITVEDNEKRRLSISL